MNFDTLTQVILPVTGEKIQSLQIADGELRFVNKKFGSVSEFEETWGKTITLAGKISVKFNDIKSITREAGSEEVFVNYKQALGVPGSIGITFEHDAIRDEFLAYFEKMQYFSRTDEPMSAFKAIGSRLFYLVVTLAATYGAYITALDLQNGVALNPDSSGSSRRAGKSRIFYWLVDTLGVTGCLLVGGAIAAYLIYVIWKRYSNPPVQTRLTPVSGN